MLLKKIKNLRGIRTRVALLFVAIFGSTLIAFSALLYSAFTRNHQNEFDADLFNHAVDVSRAIGFDTFGNLSVDSELLSGSGKVFPFAVGKAFIQILNTEGKVLAASRTLEGSNLPLDPEDMKSISENGYAFRTITSKKMPNAKSVKNQPYRLVTYFARQQGSASFILQIAVSMHTLEQEAQRLLVFLLLAIPLTLIVAAFGGWYLSGSALKPISAIIEKAKHLQAENLADRLPVPSTNDEIRQLSLTLNALLDRLQQAFESQDRFVADASHELKTPLAIMRGELDLLKNRCKDSNEISEFVESASQELDHLSKLVQDLLLLARVDAGANSLSVHEARLDEVILEAIARLEKIAARKDIKIRVDLFTEDFVVKGDSALLQSLFQNLIENALKFAPRGQPIEVRVTNENGALVVAVEDHGPGIPHEIANKIFDRFYRASPVSEGKQGFGLGLAIAKRIADAHGAELTFTSRIQPPSGTTFRVQIKNF
jgi:signal transduction histidine kinase